MNLFVSFRHLAWVTAVASLLAATLEAAEGDPLKLVGKTVISASERGLPQSMDVRLTVRNDSDKLITAYRVSCLAAESDGNFSVSSVEAETFLELEDGDFQPSAEGPIAPGGLREFIFGHPDWTAAEPYAAMSCGVETVIFEDGSSWGVAGTAERLFERRRRVVHEVAEVIEGVRWILGGGEVAVGAQLSAGNSYADTLELAKSRSGDRVFLEEMAEALQGQVAFVERHLPDRSNSLGEQRPGAVR